MANSHVRSPGIGGSQVLLGQLFRCHVLGLYKLVHHFGGVSLAEGLDTRVADAARLHQWLLDVRHGRIHRFRSDLSWSVYRVVMETAVEYTVSVAGRQLVQRRIRSVTRALEERTGLSCFEVAYRLGLHRPGLDRAA